MGRGGNWNFTAVMRPSPDELASVFGRFAARAVDFSPCWPDATDAMVQETAAIISSRGAMLSAEATYGHAWLPADNRYLRRKARVGRGAVDLMWSGMIRNAVSSRAGVLSQGPGWLRFGVRAKHAVAMNFAFRPFMGWTGRLRARTQEIMSNYLAALCAQAESQIQGQANGG
jgi:hypothetical protein